MKNKEKMQKYLQRDFELIFVLYLILSILDLVTFFNMYGILVTILRVGVLVGLWFAIRAAKKGQKNAGVYGIVLSILMILSGGTITFLLGIFMCIHSIVYLVNYDKCK